MQVLLYERFGLGPDPWAELDVRTADAVRTAQMVRAACEHGAFVRVVGPRGAGKTRAVRRALARQAPRLVEPLRLRRERLHLGDVETAVVRDLSDERPRHSAEARSGQVRRLLRQAGRGARIVLLIDDAHVLHHATIRGLKRLRELGGHDRRPALGVVLVGQSDRAASVPEVGLRSDAIAFAGLTRAEAHGAVEAVLGKRVDASAATLLAESPRARNWLDLEALVDDCLVEAAGRGADVVDAAVARAVMDPAGASRAAPRPPARASDEAVGEALREAAA